MRVPQSSTSTPLPATRNEETAVNCVFGGYSGGWRCSPTNVMAANRTTLVGSYELFMKIIRGARQPDGGVPGAEHGSEAVGNRSRDCGIICRPARGRRCWPNARFCRRAGARAEQGRRLGFCRCSGRRNQGLPWSSVGVDAADMRGANKPVIRPKESMVAVAESCCRGRPTNRTAVRVSGDRPVFYRRTETHNRAGQSLEGRRELWIVESDRPRASVRCLLQRSEHISREVGDRRGCHVGSLQPADHSTVDGESA
jgi:hypothetical protein